MKRKPEEELIDLTTEATPWKKTENKTPGGTSVQPKETATLLWEVAQRNHNSPAQQQAKKEFNPKKPQLPCTIVGQEEFGPRKESTLTIRRKHLAVQQPN